MKRVLSLTVLLAVVVGALPAVAEPVPRHAAGIWSVGECGGGGLSVLAIEGRGQQARVAVAGAEWLGGSVVLATGGAEGELVLPPLGSLHRCDALPSAFSLMFAESIAAFGEIREIEQRCATGKSGAARCVALAFDLIDVSGDGRFSKAELSRAVRAASLFVGHRVVAERSRDPWVSLESLSVAWVSASLIGPFLATNLIASYDFDGDGLLSLKELMQDRSPEQGLQGVAAGVAAGLPPGMTSGLMSFANDLVELLR